MTMSALDPIQRVFDDNGLPLAGAKLRFYNPGTTTPRVVYTDSALTIAHAQPVLSDAAGFFPRVFVGAGAYKRTLHGPTDVALSAEDNIDPGLGSGTSVLGLLVSEGPATVRSALGVPSTAVTDGLDTRVTNLESVLDVPLLAPAVTDTYAAIYTPIFTADETHSVTLTGPVTINAPTVTDGQHITLILRQDGTGGRTAVFNANYRFPGGSPPALSRSANAVDVFKGFVVSSSEIQMMPPKIQDDAVIEGAWDIVLEDEKTSGTAGGASVTGSDQVRTLNQKRDDPRNYCTLAANQFVLQPGTYDIEWSAPAYAFKHQSMLYSVTAAAVVKRGTNEDTNGYSQTRSTGYTRVVITAPTTYEIRHRTSSAVATEGLGRPASFGAEIYTTVKIKRVA